MLGLHLFKTLAAFAALLESGNSNSHLGHFTYSQLNEDSILLHPWHDIVLAYSMSNWKPHFGHVTALCL
ncbi:MAG: hypothetical protein QXS09_00690 [Candidatus Bathyarchaeia archaeon]